MSESNQIRVIIADDDSSRQKALGVRHVGYGKYFGDAPSVSDHHDAHPKTTLLLAIHRVDGPIGTMRMMDSRCGPIELDDYLNLGHIFEDAPYSFAEATRLAVLPGAHSRITKLLLWKSFMLICKTRRIDKMVIWTKASASRDYRSLLFSSLGEVGKFRHPRIGNIEHETFTTDVPGVADRFRQANHPLHDFMFVSEHPGILL